ncbi:MAG: hypothetical protein HQ581_16055 [Planctomycetes bacterium]|nr:hypothetical protein [Planctomycetota bacterium]
MGYREDLIDRLRHDGLWDQIPAEQQKRFENLTDNQARRMMVMDDQWDRGDQEAIEMFGLMSLLQVIGTFKGVLVQHGGEEIGKLSKAGRLLAEFFLELKEQGLSADDVDAGLRKLSPLVVAAIATVYQRAEESGP